METRELFEQLQNKAIIKLNANEIICPTCKGLRMVLTLNDDGHGYVDQCKDCYNGKLTICPYCGKANRTDYCNCDAYKRAEKKVQEQKKLETMQKAKHIKFSDYDGKFFSLYDENRVIDKERFEEEYSESFNPDRSPKYVFATKPHQHFNIDIYDIISDLCEDGYEEMYSYLDIDSPLLSQAQELLDKWIKEDYEQIKIYYEDKSIVVDLTELSNLQFEI